MASYTISSKNTKIKVDKVYRRPYSRRTIEMVYVKMLTRKENKGKATIVYYMTHYSKMHSRTKRKDYRSLDALTRGVKRNDIGWS